MGLPQTSSLDVAISKSSILELDVVFQQFIPLFTTVRYTFC